MVWTPGRGSQLTPVPPVNSPNLEELEINPIRPPYSFIRILYDKDRSEYLYETWEPHLNRREKEMTEITRQPETQQPTPSSAPSGP